MVIIQRIMKYKLIVNHPFQSTHNVLTITLRLLLSSDPGLKRLEDLWRLYPDHLSLYDSFNRSNVPVAVSIEEGEKLLEHYHFFVFDTWYKPHPRLSVSQLNDVLEVVNDQYNDLFYIKRTPIGYGFFRACDTLQE